MQKLTILENIGVILSEIYSAFSSDENPPETVHFNLDKYLGKWYEVARFKNSFEPSNAKNIEAKYSLNNDNSIRVENSMYVGDHKKVIVGKAVSSDSKDPYNGKLYVFFSFFPGNYWIIKLKKDSKRNYIYSVVSDPTKKYLWILSKSEEGLYEEELEEILDFLVDNGYDLSELIIHKDMIRV